MSIAAPLRCGNQTGGEPISFVEARTAVVSREWAMAASRRYLSKQLMAIITVVLPGVGDKNVLVDGSGAKVPGRWTHLRPEHGRKDVVQLSEFVSNSGGPLLILTKWRRIRLISSGSSMTAMTFILEPHLGQTNGSIGARSP